MDSPDSAQHAPQENSKPRGMKTSPSLMFDILVEEDSNKQMEKYRRGSLDIAQGNVGANGTSRDVSPGFKDNANPQRPHMSATEVLKELLGDLYVDPGRLREVGMLGEGGFASVRKCMLKDDLINFEEPVAVKYLKEFTSSVDLKEFLLEANLLRKMRHSHIVRLRGVGAGDVSDLGAARKSIYLVEEFMAGGDLKQLLLEQVKDPFRPLYSKSDALRWALQLAESMWYLHAVCKPMIIHRDLKLDNLLLSAENPKEAQLKLADFGLHKRVRKLDSGALAPWISDFSSRHHLGGPDAERSYYGGSAFASVRNGALALDAQASAEQLTKLASANNMSHSDLAILTATGPQAPNGAYDPALDASVHRKIAALHAINASTAPASAPLAPPPAGALPAAVVVADATAGAAAGGPAGAAAGAAAPAAASLPPGSSGLPAVRAGPSGSGRGGSAAAAAAGGAEGASIKFIEGTQRVGSLLYMAPEVLKGQPYNEKVDVFSYGIILYELLSASHLMVRVCISEGPEAMGPYARRVADGHREPIPSWWPKEVGQLVADCWAHDPRHRPSFETVVKRLQQLQREGAAEEMERNRPSGVYSPLCDCGCTIM